MFIASLEQMRRYGVAESDIRAAMTFARRITALDAAVFPDSPCSLKMARHDGPSVCARFVTVPAYGEFYVLFVESLTERLQLQALGLLAEHAHRGTTDETTAQSWLIDAIALHEVRHRLQEHFLPSLRMWTMADLFPKDREVMEQILQTVGPGAITAREIDARIVEYHYVADRFAGRNDPVLAVRRTPRP